MKHVVHRAAAVVGLMLAAGAVLAQNPPPRPPAGQPPPDTAAMPPGPEWQPGMRMQGPPDRERLQQEIQERFARRVQIELGLNDQQMDRLRQASRANEDRHRELARREEDLHRGVMGQLQPGVAANQDSLARLLDAIAANHVARAQLEQQEIRELAQFLTPVQRARLLMMRRAFMDQVEEIRERFRPERMPRERFRQGPGGPGQPPPRPWRE